MTENPYGLSEGSERSESLFQSAREIFPGGVSHNIRYSNPYPIFIESASGATLRDVDGNEYVDYWMNHQASILGHAHPQVVKAVKDQAERGFHFGALNEKGVELGKKILEAFPSADRLRFCASGTEATMYAVRLARAYTGKNHVLKAEGGWHGGNTDLSKAVHTPFDQPTTTGLPPGIEDHVHGFQANDQFSVERLLDEYDLAAILIEPILLAGGGVTCTDSFLEFLREATMSRDALLIFDEVVTGFRASPGSYQARVGVDPDLTTFGKFPGGGLPIGGFAGRKDLFENARPDLDIPQGKQVLAGGGTFTMNPMTATAGTRSIELMNDEPVRDYTESRAERVRQAWGEIFADAGIESEVLGTSSLFCPHFQPSEPLSHVGAVENATNREALTEFHRRLFKHGHYHSPGHMGSISYQTSDEQIDNLLDASEDVVRSMRSDGVV